MSKKDSLLLNPCGVLIVNQCLRTMKDMPGKTIRKVFNEDSYDDLVYIDEAKYHRIIPSSRIVDDNFIIITFEDDTAIKIYASGGDYNSGYIYSDNVDSLNKYEGFRVGIYNKEKFLAELDAYKEQEDDLEDQRQRLAAERFIEEKKKKAEDNARNYLSIIKNIDKDSILLEQTLNILREKGIIN